MSKLLSRLKHHPFPMATTLQDSFVLLYAVELDALRSFCPPGLVLERVNDTYGLVAVATVKAAKLRLRGAPKLLGHDFMLTGYRVVVRFTAPDGTVRRALRIIASDTDSTIMNFGGNLFTEYNYQQATIDSSYDDTRTRYSIKVTDRSGTVALNAHADIATDNYLPVSSPFTSPREARRYTGPLPWTVSYDSSVDSYVGVRGHREVWHPRLVEAQVDTCTFFDRPEFAPYQHHLAAAFYINDVGYSWDRGVLIPAAAGRIPTDNIRSGTSQSDNEASIDDDTYTDE
jgi:hypothetical protein